MMEMRIGQTIVGALVVAIPWVVIWMALHRSRGRAREAAETLAAPRSVRRLLIATIPCVAGIVAVGLSTDPPSRAFAATLATSALVLCTLGWRALQNIGEAAAHLCEVDSAVRHADLVPRRVGDYLPAIWRAIPIGIAAAGAAAMVWRLTLPQPDRRVLVPIVFSAAALIFAWLFDTMATQEVRAGRVGAAGSTDLRRIVRTIFAWGCTLAVGFAAASHWLLDANWTEGATTMIVTAVMGAAGAAGCAFILAHEITRRRYRARADA
jgi:hypothetical protein